MALESALCCFNSKTALYLEKINLILTVCGIFLNILKLCIIQWGATSYSMEFLAVLNFIFLAINMILVFFFFLLRLKNMINDYNYKACYFICCFMIFFSLLCFFFEFLQMWVVLSDLYYYTGTYYTLSKEVVVSDGEWFIAFFTIVPMVVFWVIFCMLWISECMRVVVKTSGSYEDYINDNVEVVIVNKGKNKVNAYDQQGQRIQQKNKDGKDVAVKPKDISAVSITYA